MVDKGSRHGYVPVRVLKLLHLWPGCMVPWTASDCCGRGICYIGLTIVPSCNSRSTKRSWEGSIMLLLADGSARGVLLGARPGCQRLNALLLSLVVLKYHAALA